MTCPPALPSEKKKKHFHPTPPPPPKKKKKNPQKKKKKILALAKTIQKLDHVTFPSSPTRQEPVKSVMMSLSLPLHKKKKKI